MSFIAPWVLWGSLAAGIPIAIHFLFRSRFRTVEWAAMEFLRQSIEQTHRRIRFQELLLLIVRCLTLLLLAIALARPVWRGVVGGGGDAVDVVLLIDTSLSMDAKDGPATRLDRAKSAAGAILDHLPPGSSAQVITFSDRAELIGPRRGTDLDQAKGMLGAIVPTARGSDLATGLAMANEVLRRGNAPQRELYVFTDAQTGLFDRQPGAIDEAAGRIAEVASFYFCRCGRELAHNATIIALEPQTGLPHTGERVGFSILVKNTGRQPLRDLVVSLTADGNDRQQESTPVAKLEPGETRAVALTARWSEAGLRWVTARVRSDDLAGDDRLDRVIRVRERVRVLVVDGAPNTREPERAASFFLLHALAPVKEADRARYYLQTRVIAPSQATQSYLVDADVCVLANVALERDAGKPGESLSPDFVESVYRFVREGKSLVVFAGDRADPAGYARAMVDRVPMLPLRPKRVWEYADRQEPGIDRGSLTDPAFAKFRDDDTYQTFAQVRTQKLWECDELPAVEGRPSGRVLVRATDGKPLIASRVVGAGSVALVTTSPDSTWTDLPVWVNANVPIIDALIAHLLLSEADNHNAPAGLGLRLYAPASQAERAFALFRPDGERVRLGKPEPELGRLRVSAPDTPLAGLYRIGPADASESFATPFAVSFDREEATQPDTLADAAIDDRLGRRPIHLSVTDDLTAFRGGERSSREWTPRLLWVLLALAVGESLLAWYVGRPQ